MRAALVREALAARKDRNGSPAQRRLIAHSVEILLGMRQKKISNKQWDAYWGMIMGCSQLTRGPNLSLELGDRRLVQVGTSRFFPPSTGSPPYACLLVFGRGTVLSLPWKPEKRLKHARLHSGTLRWSFL